jgi:F-type H+-transporting ATPase subunit delta
MRKTAAAKRYAKALFALAQEEGRVDAVRAEVKALADLLAASPELHSIVFRPLHPLAERKAALDAVVARLGASDTVRRFLSLLLDQHRMDGFPEVCEELERLANEASGRALAEVVTASELSADQLERLRQALAARTRREVALQVRVDPSILGGVVAKVGDLVFDGSIRTQVAQLRANLMKGH